MRWTDEEREEAADACAMMASSRASIELGGGEVPGLSYFLRHDLHIDGRAHDLARSALWSVEAGHARERWGWLPGDEM